ncbi:MAG: NlpC/P60 family protein [Ilumatobacteraceae bacterium]
MFRPSSYWFAALAFVVLTTSTTQVARADSVDDARRKVQQMADQLEKAEADVDRLSEELRIAEDDKMRLDEEIVVTQAEIDRKEAELGGVRDVLAELAVIAFTSGGRGGSITGLLSVGSGPNESVQKQILTDIALNTGLADTDQLDALIDDLGDLEKKLAKDLQRTKDLAESIGQARLDAEDEIGKYTQLKAKAERDLGQALRDERERRARAAAAAAAAAAANLANQRPSSGSSSGASGSSNGSSGSSSSSGGNRFDPSTIPPTTSRAGIAIAAARSQIGVPYRYAAATEGVAFDCSGLTMWAWAQAGVSLPHQSRRQFSSSPRIPIEYIEPGDLIFFYNPISHVSLYVGGGMMVDAPGVGRTVRLKAVNWSKVVGATRPG